jgi:hypothetical protein
MEIETRGKNFGKHPEYDIARKFVRRELNCSMRTEGRTDGQKREG